MTFETLNCVKEFYFIDLNPNNTTLVSIHKILIKKLSFIRNINYIFTKILLIKCKELKNQPFPSLNIEEQF